MSEEYPGAPLEYDEDDGSLVAPLDTPQRRKPSKLSRLVTALFVTLTAAAVVVLFVTKTMEQPESRDTDRIEAAISYLEGRYGISGFEIQAVDRDALLAAAGGDASSIKLAPPALYAVSCEGRDFTVYIQAVSSDKPATDPASYMITDTLLHVLVSEKCREALEGCLAPYTERYKYASMSTQDSHLYESWRANPSIARFLHTLDLKEVAFLRVSVALDRAGRDDEECAALARSIIADWDQLTDSRTRFSVTFLPTDVFESANEPDVLGYSAGQGGYLLFRNS
ncbi:MAG: hypothetical protein LBD25_01105 [Coriobacteriales bacterium]|jgi:hypothetical protein|nr:hypothetical protein [Coriobacteriales bacterium]